MQVQEVKFTFWLAIERSDETDGATFLLFYCGTITGLQLNAACSGPT